MEDDGVLKFTANEKPRRKGVKKTDPAKNNKIYENLDKKALNSERKGKQADIKNSFTEDLPEFITDEEKQIIKSSTEIALIYEAGVLYRVIKGERETFKVSLNSIEGKIVSHNHPGGRGLSDTDIGLLLGKPKQIRIVTGDRHLYTLRSFSDLTEDRITEIKKFYLSVSKKGGDTKDARLKAMILTNDKFSDIEITISHE